MTVYSFLNSDFTSQVVGFNKNEPPNLQLERDMTLSLLNSIEKIRDNFVKDFIKNGFNIDKVNFYPLVKEVKDKLFLAWCHGFAIGLDSGNDVAEFTEGDPLSVMDKRIRTIQNIIKRLKDPNTSDEQRLKDKKAFPVLVDRYIKLREETLNDLKNKRTSDNDLELLNTFDIFENQVNGFIPNFIPPTDTISEIKSPKKKTVEKVKSNTEQINSEIEKIKQNKNLTNEQKIQEINKLKLDLKKQKQEDLNSKRYEQLMNTPEYTTKMKYTKEKYDALNRTLKVNKYATESSFNDGFTFLTQSDFGRVYLENRLDYISKMYGEQEKEAIIKRLTEYVQIYDLGTGETKEPIAKSRIISDNDSKLTSVIQRYFENESLSYNSKNRKSYIGDSSLTDFPKSELPISEQRNDSIIFPKTGGEKKLFTAVKNAMYPPYNKQNKLQSLNALAQNLLNKMGENDNTIQLTPDEALMFGFTTKREFSKDLLRKFANMKNDDYFISKVGRVMATEVQAAHHLGRLTNYYHRGVELVRWIPNARSKTGICEPCTLNSLNNSKGLPTTKFGLSGIYYFAETLNNPKLAIPKHPYCLCLLRPLTKDEMDQVVAAGYEQQSETMWSMLMGAIASQDFEQFMTDSINKPGVTEKDKSWWSINGDNFLKGLGVTAAVASAGLMSYYFMKSLTGKQLKQVFEKAVEKEILTDTQVGKSMFLNDVAKGKIKTKADLELLQLPVKNVAEDNVGVLEDLRPIVNLPVPELVENRLTEEWTNTTARIMEYDVYGRKVVDGTTEIPNLEQKNASENLLNEALNYLKNQNFTPEQKLYAKAVQNNIENANKYVGELNVLPMTNDNIVENYNKIASVNFGDTEKLNKALEKLQQLNNSKQFDENFTKRDYDNFLKQGREAAKNITNVEKQFYDFTPEPETHINYVENVLNEIENADEIVKSNFETYKQIQDEIKTLRNNLSNVREENRYLKKTGITPDIIGGSNISKIGAINKTNEIMTNLVNKNFENIKENVFEQLLDKYKDKLYEIKTENLNPPKPKEIQKIIYKYKDSPNNLSQREIDILKQLVEIHKRELTNAEFRLSNVINNILQKNDGILFVNFSKKNK